MSLITQNLAPVFLDFPVREVHCDASAETEWENLAQNVQSLQLDPAPPPVKSKLSFLPLRKSTENILATYYW